MFTTPVKARLYQSTDKDAPVFANRANALMLLLKACLVTGYGDKEGAGWQVIESSDQDTQKDSKTFVAPTITDGFGVKVWGDTGTQMQVQIVQEDTVLAQCATPFYHKLNNSHLHKNKWCVIASDCGFWFFAEQANGNHIPQDRSGVYLYAGQTQTNHASMRGLYLKHTGGSWGQGDDDRYSITQNDNTSGQAFGKLRCNNKTYDVNPMSLFTGSQALSDEITLSPMVLAVKDGVFGLPIFGASNNNTPNQTIMDGHICHSTALHTAANNVFVPIYVWQM